MAVGAARARGEALTGAHRAINAAENGTGPAEGADGDAGDAAGDGDEPNEDKAEGGDVGEIELEVGPAHEGREGETSEEQRLNALSAWIRRRILIRGLERNEEFSEENELIVREFLTHPGTRKLVAYMGEDGLAVATFRNPPLDAGDTEFVYFVKRGDAELTPDNVARHVRFGCSRGNALESLLHTMVGVHAPRAATYRRMPATVQKDFAANLHRFMASLTGACSKLGAALRRPSHARGCRGGTPRQGQDGAVPARGGLGGPAGGGCGQGLGAETGALPRAVLVSAFRLTFRARRKARSSGGRARSSRS